MLVDTHAHVNLDHYKNDADEVINRALGNGVSMINVGVDFKTSKKAIGLAEKFSGVWAAVGFHPNDSREEFSQQALKELALNPRVVGIGETGLDYYRIKGNEEENKNNQKEIFKKQIELALELKKPLIIHCREAHSAGSGQARSAGSGQAHGDLLEILKSYFINLKSKQAGVLHSFSGNLEQAEKYREMGFKIAFNGIITFSRDYDEVILKTPLEDILIETDCPFLAPVPYRGQRNEPLHVIEVAKKIAEIKGALFDEIASQTTANACKVFNL